MRYVFVHGQTSTDYSKGEEFVRKQLRLPEQAKKSKKKKKYLKAGKRRFGTWLQVPIVRKRIL